MSRLAPFASGVSAIVPTGFEAYVRVFHPVPAMASGLVAKQEPVTWADVAARTGAVMHPLAQYDAIAGVPRSAKRERAGVGEPRTGHLEPDALNALCAVLARHTSTPERCWFALWEGYGWMQGSPAMAMLTLDEHPAPTAPGDPGYVPPAFPPDVIKGPRFRIPQRDYFLLEGPVAAAGESGHRPRSDVFFPQSPNIFWPDDRAWCVATEIDLDSTYVGGSEALAQALLAEPRLETGRVEPGDPINAYSDSINPLGGSRYNAPPRRSMRSPHALVRLVARAFARLRPRH